MLFTTSFFNFLAWDRKQTKYPLTLSLPKHLYRWWKLLPRKVSQRRFAGHQCSFRNLCSILGCMTSGNWSQRSYDVLQTCRNHFAKDIAWRHNGSEWVKTFPVLGEVAWWRGKGVVHLQVWRGEGTHWERNQCETDGMAVDPLTHRNGYCTTQPSLGSRDSLWPISLRTVYFESNGELTFMQERGQHRIVGSWAPLPPPAPLPHRRLWLIHSAGLLRTRMGPCNWATGLPPDLTTYSFAAFGQNQERQFSNLAPCFPRFQLSPLPYSARFVVSPSVERQ